MHKKSYRDVASQLYAARGKIKSSAAKELAPPPPLVGQILFFITIK